MASRARATLGLRALGFSRLLVIVGFGVIGFGFVRFGPLADFAPLAVAFVAGCLARCGRRFAIGKARRHLFVPIGHVAAMRGVVEPGVALDAGMIEAIEAVDVDV